MTAFPPNPVIPAKAGIHRRGDYADRLFASIGEAMDSRLRGNDDGDIRRQSPVLRLDRPDRIPSLAAPRRLA
jgi:hypothetical protein